MSTSIYYDRNRIECVFSAAIFYAARALGSLRLKTITGKYFEYKSCVPVRSTVYDLLVTDKWELPKHDVIVFVTEPLSPEQYVLLDYKAFPSQALRTWYKYFDPEKQYPLPMFFKTLESVYIGEFDTAECLFYGLFSFLFSGGPEPIKDALTLSDSFQSTGALINVIDYIKTGELNSLVLHDSAEHVMMSMYRTFNLCNRVHNVIKLQDMRGNYKLFMGMACPLNMLEFFAYHAVRKSYYQLEYSKRLSNVLTYTPSEKVGYYTCCLYSAHDDAIALTRDIPVSGNPRLVTFEVPGEHFHMIRGSGDVSGFPKWSS